MQKKAEKREENVALLTEQIMEINYMLQFLVFNA